MLCVWRVTLVIRLCCKPQRESETKVSQTITPRDENADNGHQQEGLGDSERAAVATTRRGGRQRHAGHLPLSVFLATLVAPQE